MRGRHEAQRGATSPRTVNVRNVRKGDLKALRDGVMSGRRRRG